MTCIYCSREFKIQIMGICKKVLQLPDLVLFTAYIDLTSSSKEDGLEGEKTSRWVKLPETVAAQI